MTIAELAQRIMDLYYQQYKNDEDLFTLDDFVSQVKTTYSQQIIREYEIDKSYNRQAEGFSYVTLPIDMLREVELPVKEVSGRVVVELPMPVFVFPYDSMSSGVQEVVYNCNGKSKDMIKVSVNDRWKIPMIKYGNNSYYSVEYKRLVIEKSACKLNKVTVSYVPDISSLSGDDAISGSRANDIEVSVLQKMVAAKDGSIVDMSNNSNPNKALEGEIDSSTLKQ